MPCAKNITQRIQSRNTRKIRANSHRFTAYYEAYHLALTTHNQDLKKQDRQNNLAILLFLIFDDSRITKFQ